MFYLISFLPINILYINAYIIKLFNKHILCYRIDIVTQNILKSFPQINKQNLENLIDLFYKEFFNTIFEIIKSIQINKKQICERVKLENLHIIKKSLKKGKPIVLLSGHYANTEWLGLRLSLENIKFTAVYKELKNQHVNNLMLSIRTKFGAQLIPLHKWRYFILKHKNKPCSLSFLADQVPSSIENGKRIDFLNQSTLFHTGPEKTARLLNADVFYVEMRKLKRGFYSVNFKLMESNNITQEYAAILEKTIKVQPASWLWSHKRWKR